MQEYTACDLCQQERPIEELPHYCENCRQIKQQHAYEVEIAENEKRTAEDAVQQLRQGEPSIIRKPASRAMTQTALVVANGKTQVALDVEIGKRRVLRAEDGTIIRPEGSVATAAQRTWRVNHNQGELFG